MWKFIILPNIEVLLHTCFYYDLTKAKSRLNFSEYSETFLLEASQRKYNWADTEAAILPQASVSALKL